MQFVNKIVFVMAMRVMVIVVKTKLTPVIM